MINNNSKVFSFLFNKILGNCSYACGETRAYTFHAQ